MLYLFTLLNRKDLLTRNGIYVGNASTANFPLVASFRVPTSHDAQKA